METNFEKLFIGQNLKNEYGIIILTSKNFLIGKFSKGKKEIMFQSNIEIWKNKSRGCTRMRFMPIIIKHNSEIFRLIHQNVEKIFIKDNSLNISGFIIAGDVEIIKKYLNYIQTIQFNKYILTIIELEKEGELGFNEAIKLSMIND